jgi:hypothetical protein
MIGRMKRFGGFLAANVILLAGCGVAPKEPCTLTLVMNPAVATADHRAAAPGNSVQFDVGYAAQPGCAAPEIVYLPTMTTSDPLDVSLPSPGVATCVGATNGAATLTDTRSRATALLTCK